LAPTKPVAPVTSTSMAFCTRRTLAEFSGLPIEAEECGP
jgi:hypothetical protein